MKKSIVTPTIRNTNPNTLNISTLSQSIRYRVFTTAIIFLIFFLLKEGYTILHFAIRSNESPAESPAIVQLVLEAGADVNAKTMVRIKKVLYLNISREIMIIG